LIDPSRIELIEQIEKERDSVVITWLTGDRKGLETKIAFDQISLLYDHLVEIGPQKRIDLYIYSPGGMTLAGFGAVNLIREFCEHFSVLIPFRALSCASLISLGADEIVMSRLGQLSPVDPSVASPYNPSLPSPQPGSLNFLPLSVEDVGGYLDLARKEFGLGKEESMLRVLEWLSSKVHPIALGSVQRSREQIGMLATKLMSSQASKPKKETIDRVVKVLTRELGSHDYIISRKEAKEDLGLPVVYPTPESEGLMWKLFKKYQRAMELTNPYNQDALLGSNREGDFTFRRAYVESKSLTHVFETLKRLKRVDAVMQGVPTSGFQEQTLSEGWVEYRPQTTTQS